MVPLKDGSQKINKQNHDPSLARIGSGAPSPNPKPKTETKKDRIRDEEVARIDLQIVNANNDNDDDRITRSHKFGHSRWHGWPPAVYSFFFFCSQWPEVSVVFNRNCLNAEVDRSEREPHLPQIERVRNNKQSFLLSVLHNNKCKHWSPISGCQAPCPFFLLCSATWKLGRMGPSGQVSLNLLGIGAKIFHPHFTFYNKSIFTLYKTVLHTNLLSNLCITLFYTLEISNKSIEYISIFYYNITPFLN